MDSLNESSKLKKNKVGEVQSLDPDAVRREINQNLVTRKNTEFNLRSQNQQRLRKLEKAATPQTSLPVRVRVRVRGQKAQPNLRRDIEQDASTILRNQRLQKLQAKDKRAVQDIERHREKMQRRCKHLFSQITKKCELCGKPCSAHI